MELTGQYPHSAWCTPQWAFYSKRYKPVVEELYYGKNKNGTKGTNVRERLHRLLWAMSTAAHKIASDYDGTEVTDNRGKFNATRKALTYYATAMNADSAT